MTFDRDFVRRKLKLGSDVRFHTMSPHSFNELSFMNTSRSTGLFTQYETYKYDLHFSCYFDNYLKQHGGKAYFFIMPKTGVIDKNICSYIIRFNIVEYDIEKQYHNTRISYIDCYLPVVDSILTTSQGNTITVKKRTIDPHPFMATYIDLDDIYFMENYKGTTDDGSSLNDFPLCDMMGIPLKENDILLKRNFTILQLINTHALGFTSIKFVVTDGGKVIPETRKEELQRYRDINTSTMKIGSRNFLKTYDLIRAPKSVYQKVIEWKLTC